MLLKSAPNHPGRSTTEEILDNQLDLLARFQTFGFNHTFLTGLEIATEGFNATRYAFAKVPATPLVNPNPLRDTSRQRQSRRVPEVARKSPGRRAPASRRIVVVAVPPIDELDLVGPLQVFNSVNRLAGRSIYSIEVATNADRLTVEPSFAYNGSRTRGNVP